jgi:hypothetical protein
MPFLCNNKDRKFDKKSMCNATQKKAERSLGTITKDTKETSKISTEKTHQIFGNTTRIDGSGGNEARP